MVTTTLPSLAECKSRLAGVEAKLADEETPLTDRPLLKKEKRFLRSEIAKATEADQLARQRADAAAARQHAAVLEARVGQLHAAMARASACKDPRKKAELVATNEIERAELNRLVNSLGDEDFAIVMRQNRQPKNIAKPRPPRTPIPRPLSDGERIASLESRLAQAEAKLSSLKKQPADA